MQLELFNKPAYYNTSFEDDKNEFESKTGIKFYIDGFGTFFCGKKMLDIIRIDRELIRQYGEYIENGISMREFITSIFGEDIFYIFNKWTTPPVQVYTYYRLFNTKTKSYLSIGYNSISEDEMKKEVSFYGYLYGKLKKKQRELPLEKMLAICDYVIETSNEPFKEQEDPSYFEI